MDIVVLTDEELEALHGRFPYPRFSKEEYERRYARVYELMRQHQLDCLLVAGGSGSYGRLWSNVRYLTNMLGKAEQVLYVLVPKAGEPFLVLRGGRRDGRPHMLSPGMLARSVVKTFVLGSTATEAVARLVGEWGYEAGRIGIVEFDPNTSLPSNDLEDLRSRLPKATFAFVTRDFLAMRLVKGAEEIAALERSARLGDLVIQALVARVRPGMTEGEAFGIAYEAALRHGGELGMIQLASTEVDSGDINDQRPRPVPRVIREGDFLNTEIGVFYNGYEAQTGKPIFMSEPPAEYQSMFGVALETYHAIAATLFPGKTPHDSRQAVKRVSRAGYELYGAFLQGMHGTNPRHEPVVRLNGGDGAESLVYQEGMVFVIQCHLVDLEHTKGLFLADTFAITSEGPRCLNQVPPQLFTVSQLG